MNKNFEKLWKEFVNSKFDIGSTRKKTAWNFQRFLYNKKQNLR